VAIARGLARSRGGVLRRAPFTFTPANGVGFCEDVGWTVLDIESMLFAARRFVACHPSYDFCPACRSRVRAGQGQSSRSAPWSD
jgi:hypothetical protein